MEPSLAHPQSKLELMPGKYAGLRAVSTERGIIAALALDQRGSLAALMEAAAGRRPAASELSEFKEAVARALTPHVSAILLDFEYGHNAASGRAPGTGLLLAYEQDAYMSRDPERLPQLIPELSVKRLKEGGAQCMKVLVHYSPSSSPGTNDIKKALVERVGAECRAEDIPFFLEVIGYDARLDGGKGGDFAQRKPAISIQNVSEFSQGRYGVDVLKIGFPVDMKRVADTPSLEGTPAYSRSEATAFFKEAAAACGKPFIYLSAGVSHEEFVEGLALAAEAGVPYAGVLCGRATWQDGARIYAQHGLAQLERWLKTKGTRNIMVLNDCLKNARPWYGNSADTVSRV